MTTAPASGPTIADTTPPRAGPGSSSPAGDGRPTTTRRPSRADRHTARRRRGIAVRYGLAFGGYLALSLVLWWNVWSTHPTTVTTCGCGDTSLFLWFVEWPAYALAHGHDPFYSTAVFHPAGIDLLSNTSVLAVGIVLAPVTWLFGPVATLNVASTLGPALSALAMFWLLRRWVRWAPAAFAGGLLFGFSPFVLVNVAGGHLMTSVLVPLPLMAGALDELFLRRRHSPLVVGAGLGLLVVVEFFLSTEMLVIFAMTAVAGTLLLVLYGAVLDRGALAVRAPDAARGLGVAALVSGALLAYPLWVALDGPAHLAGPIWPTIPPGAGGISLGNVWHLRFMTTLQHAMQSLGGYQGAALPQAEYLGVALLVVLGGGLVLWHRDRALWFFGALGAVSVVLSLGTASFWTPWRLVAHLPLLDSLIPGRFAAITAGCAGAMLAVVLDRTRTAVRARAGGVVPRRLTPVLAGAAALGVGVVALVPLGQAFADNVPFTTRTVAAPRWFTEVGTHLPPGQVVLTYPAPFTLLQSAMTWQALDRLHFAMAGGSGPGGVAARAGAERPGLEVLSATSVTFKPLRPATGADVRAVRGALAGWGVTTVVVPDPVALPPVERGRHTAAALGLFTAAIGRTPRFVADAWVWTHVDAPGPARSLSPAAFARCTGVPDRALRAADVGGCVMAASHPAS